MAFSRSRLRTQMRSSRNTIDHTFRFERFDPCWVYLLRSVPLPTVLRRVQPARWTHSSPTRQVEIFEKKHPCLVSATRARFNRAFPPALFVLFVSPLRRYFDYSPVVYTPSVLVDYTNVSETAFCRYAPWRFRGNHSKLTNLQIIDPRSQIYSRPYRHSLNSRLIVDSRALRDNVKLSVRCRT